MAATLSRWLSLAYMCRLRDVKMTGPLVRVLRAFLDDAAAPRYGYDLMKAASLQSGTLYPLLARLERQKLVRSAWETPQQEGQRPRKYYRLTGEGIRVARLELARASRSRPAPARPGHPGRLAPGSLR
jgi:PadR family transcriptional regulator PadR